MSRYFSQLERQLVAAARRDSAPGADKEPTARPKRRWKPGRTALLAAALVVFAGVPAAAVTGVFRPHREPDGLVRLSERQVAAQGTASDGRHWELLVSRSDVGFCLGLRAPEWPGGPVSTGEGCGGREPGSLSVGTKSGGTIPQNAWVHGMTPDGAQSVRVQTEDDITVTVKTIDDDFGLKGRFYFAELPVQTGLGPTTIQALDADGHVVATQSTHQTPPKPKERP